MSFSEYLENVNSIDSKNQHYFAAANSYTGFVSCFDKIFSPSDFDRIYILKGGPGVGKSTLMKQTAKKALELGLTPVCYHCSSDPYSLDGLVISERKTAVLDGTSPHTVDPSAAGVKEIIVNMGTAWDTDKLFQNRHEILSLIHEKSDCYISAYRLLGAEKQLCDCMSQINKSCLLYEKLKVNAQRLSARLFKNSGTGKHSVCLTSALSCLGKVSFNTFERLAENHYFLNDLRDVAHLYLEEIYCEAKNKNVDVVVSLSPKDTSKIDGLFFPDLSLSFTLCHEKTQREFDKHGIPYKIINMRRFCDAEEYSKHREYYRFCEKCAAELENNALEYLATAGSLHEKTEALYSSATDYNKVRLLCDRVVNDICEPN